MENTTLNKLLEKVLTTLDNTKLSISNVINNVTTNAAGYALDARQGKALQDQITALDSRVHDKFIACNSSQLTLTNSVAALKCDNVLSDSNDFSVTSDGGAKCLKSGRILITGSYIAVVTNGDRLMISAGLWRNGTYASTSYTYTYGGSSTSVATVLPSITLNANEGDILYLRGYNADASRGTISAQTAKLNVEYI